MNQVLIGEFKVGFMKTGKFDLQIIGKMKKAQEFIVYPLTDPAEIMIQSKTRIGRISFIKGNGIMSQAHQSGAYGIHLNSDVLVRFQLTQEQLNDLIMNLKTLPGNAGNEIVHVENALIEEIGTI